jgi:hypothetical protein
MSGVESGLVPSPTMLIRGRLDRHARTDARLGNCSLSGGHRKRKHHLKVGSLSNHAAHFDAAMVLFHDMAGGSTLKPCGFRARLTRKNNCRDCGLSVNFTVAGSTVACPPSFPDSSHSPT